MKTMRMLAVSAVLAAGVLSVEAAFKMPPRTWTVAETEQAAAEAMKDKKPLLFLVTDTETDCPKCEGASKDILKRLRTDTVLVYCPAGTALPTAVQALIKNQDTGRFIPYAIVTDASMRSLLAILRYEEIEAGKSKAFSPVEKAIKDYTKAMEEGGKSDFAPR